MKKKIKYSLILLFGFAAVRQIILFNDYIGAFFLAVVFLSLVLNKE